MTRGARFPGIGARVIAAALVGSVCILAGMAPGLAAAPVPAKKVNAAPPSAVPLLPGAGSKEPVNITADKLDYFDKDQKLIYTGNVVAVQGDSTLKASMLTILLTKQDPPAGATAAAQPAVGAPTTGSSVRHMDAKGPVTLISKDQVGTGDAGTYDKDLNKVTLIGNVTLSQGTNVTQGDRLIYDLGTGQAQVFSGSTAGRVTSVFTPGSAPPGTEPAAPKPTPKKDKSAPSGKKTPVTPKASAAVEP